MSGINSAGSNLLALHGKICLIKHYDFIRLFPSVSSLVGNGSYTHYLALTCVTQKNLSLL